MVNMFIAVIFNLLATFHMNLG